MLAKGVFGGGSCRESRDDDERERTMLLKDGIRFPVTTDPFSTRPI